jgi:hypothetical protein
MDLITLRLFLATLAISLLDKQAERKPMTPEAFVIALANSVQECAKREADYLAALSSGRPPAHLARFSDWYRRLSRSDQEIAREMIQYSAEGSLFGLLTHLDNVASLTEEGGAFELWHVASNGSRVRLNAPDGAMLTDIFNNRT